MVMEIRIYCEGGSKRGDLFQQDMSVFLGELVSIARSKRIRWHLITCGSRGRAYESFQLAMTTFPEAFNVLLVDAESLVSSSAWQHLKQQDKWALTEELDSHCHLMAQAMEAWMIADLESLKNYYGQNFNAKSIPATKGVEQIPKDDLKVALRKASRQTSKGEYDEIKHAGAILQKLDVAKVRQAAPHCERLFKTLTEKMS